MSGIWGFTCKNQENHEKQMQALTFWTGCYGKETADQVQLPSGGMGWHVEHLSDTIPCPNKILKSEQIYKQKSGPESNHVCDQKSDSILSQKSRQTSDDQLIAVIDAVLYNREEIASSMIPSLNQTDLKHLSDEELLFRLFLEKGYQGLSSVNGDFAGAVYDEHTGTWTLFRDHLGIRPLFYYLDDQLFAFSTDMRSLTALPNADLKLNEVMFYQESAGYNALSLCRTEYEHICCVRPASQMTVVPTENGFELKTDIYWEPGRKKIRFRDPVKYRTELRNLIADSVQRRLAAVSGLVGAELSGGLDSAIIDILIARTGREAVYYSWSYDPEDHELQKDRDERQIILDICKQEHITCHFTDLPSIEKVTSIADGLKKVNPPYMNTPHLSAGSKWMSSQGARVVFTGHGGDEGVSHRANSFELWYHREYLHYLRCVYAVTEGRRLRLPRTLRIAHRDLVQKKTFFLSEYKAGIDGSELLNQSFADRICKIAPHPLLQFAYDPIAYTLQGGPQVRLNNAAFQGAENGVRYVFPFLDYRVFNYAVSIPRYQFCNEEGSRWVYRKAFDDLMPDSLRKMDYKDTPSMIGFRIPGMDYKKEFLKSKQELIDFLDWDFWGQYLNREEAEKILPADESDGEAYNRAVVKMDLLFKCAMIQNTMKNAGKMCSTAEFERSKKIK